MIEDLGYPAIGSMKCNLGQLGLHTYFIWPVIL